MSSPRIEPQENTTCATVIDALRATLHELAQALTAVGSDCYAQPTGYAFGNSTISMHVRHALDHVRVLIHADDPEDSDNHIDYDSRQRGTDIETSLDAALAEIARLCASCESLKAQPCHAAVTVRSLASKSAEPIMLRSTLGRECAFVLSHTIHHNAMIRSMAIHLDAQVPDSLGLAPSTPPRAQSSACVR